MWSKRKSFSPRVSMPSSLRLGFMSSLTIIIFRNESPVFRSEADSCASFSFVGRARADCI